MPRASKQAHKPMKGDLVKPIRVPEFPLKAILHGLSGSQACHEYGVNLAKIKQERMRILMKEKARKLNLLLEHYEVRDQTNKWFHLAMYLASDYVSGFRVEDIKSKPTKKWDDIALAKLYFDVQEELVSAENQHASTISRACKKLSKKEPWKSFLVKLDKPAKALQDKYSAAKKSSFVSTYDNMPKKSAKELKSMIDKLFEEKIES